MTQKLTKEQREQVEAVLNKPGKLARGWGQACVAIWVIWTVYIIGSLVMGAEVAVDPMFWGCTVAVVLAIRNRKHPNSPFAAYYPGFEEAGSDPEFIKQCKNKFLWLKWTCIGPLLALVLFSLYILDPWAEWLRTHESGAVPWIFLTFGLVVLIASVFAVRRLIIKTREIEWQVWEFIDSDGKC